MTDNHAAARILHPYPGLAWTEIRAAAVELAERGWPVLTGTYQLAPHAGWLGKPGATGLEPVAESWTTAATTDPAIALEWWTRRPYSVLLACGTGIDALEVPASHADVALAGLRSAGHLGPIAVTPFGTWLLFIRSDCPLIPELARRTQALLHASGGWVPLPPTMRAQRPYRWRMSPTAVGWSLPHSMSVQQALIAALDRAPQRPVRPVTTSTRS